MQQAPAKKTEELSEFVSRIRAWPAERRLRLVQEVLQTLRGDLVPEGKPRKSLKNLLGLLETGGPPPTDEECDRILEEERMRRYGS